MTVNRADLRLIVDDFWNRPGSYNREGKNAKEYTLDVVEHVVNAVEAERVKQVGELVRLGQAVGLVLLTPNEDLSPLEQAFLDTMTKLHQQQRENYDAYDARLRSGGIQQISGSASSQLDWCSGRESGVHELMRAVLPEERVRLLHTRMSDIVYGKDDE